MKKRCIMPGCGETWENGNPEVEGFSDGLCASHLKQVLTPSIQKRQKKEGNFDCFGTACGYCDQVGCRYYEPCVRGHFSEQLFAHA